MIKRKKNTIRKVKTQTHQQKSHLYISSPPRVLFTLLRKTDRIPVPRAAGADTQPRGKKSRYSIIPQTINTDISLLQSWSRSPDVFVYRLINQWLVESASISPSWSAGRKGLTAYYGLILPTRATKALGEAFGRVETTKGNIQGLRSNTGT